MTDALHYYYIRYGSHMGREIFNEENPVSKVILDELAEVWASSEKSMRSFLEEEWAEVTNTFLEDLDVLKQSLIEELEQE